MKQAEADGIKLLKEAKADQAVLAMKSFEALKEVANGQSTKLIIPSNLQDVASITSTISEMLKK